MIIQVHSQYHANDKPDAVAQATEIWQKFTGEPEAALPWATTLHVTPAEAAAPTPGTMGAAPDPRPFFVDLIIKDTRPEKSVSSA